jgi:hypothetical protein
MIRRHTIGDELARLMDDPSELDFDPSYLGDPDETSHVDDVRDDRYGEDADDLFCDLGESKFNAFEAFDDQERAEQYDSRFGPF